MPETPVLGPQAQRPSGGESTAQGPGWYGLLSVTAGSYANVVWSPLPSCGP